MKIAVISITEKGRNLSERVTLSLKEHEITRYCFYKHCDNCSVKFNTLGEIIGGIFDKNKYEAIVFISACGVAVRTVAPYIKSKVLDPAVIVIDDSRNFVIPILSGHIGKANILSELIAKRINATPVITTATDTHKKFSPDSFAVANNLIITSMTASKAIASAVLDGEKLGLVCGYKCINKPDVFSDNGKIGIYIGNENISPFETTLQLIPKNIILGIGCKKNTPCESIYNHVCKVLEENKIAIERVEKVSSIDVKSNEKGLLEFCDRLKIKPSFYTAEQLMRIDGEFSKSDFVMKTVGVDNVCERSAVISGGKLIIPKISGNGVTLAVAEREVIIDFEKELI